MNFLKFIIMISLMSVKSIFFNKNPILFLKKMISKFEYRTPYEIYYIKNNMTNAFKLYFMIDT